MGLTARVMNFKSVQIMILLVLLGACVGLSSDTYELEQRYGDRHMLRLPRDAESLEFSPMYGPRQLVVLWRRDEPVAGEAGRGQLKGHLWVIDKVTQADSGRYTVRGKDRRVILSKVITVSAHTESHGMMVGEDLKFSFDLDPASCRLTFFPEDDADSYELVSEGSLQDNFFHSRIQLLRSYSSTFVVLIESLQTSDSGRFELTDQNGNLALMVNLEVMAPAPLSFYIGVAVGVLFMVLLCRCCVKKCCCGTSPSKTDDPAPAEPDAAPTGYYQENTAEPAGPRYSQPTAVSVPSPYREVPASGGQAAAPSVPLGSDFLSSDPGPRFELKGLTFPSAPPLSSDSTHCDVYTSDKLNFR